MTAPEPFWPLAFGAGTFILIGAAIAVWPRPLIRAYVSILKPMRRLIGRELIDWEISLLEGKAAPILVRLFGLFVIFAGGSILYFQLMRTGAP